MTRSKKELRELDGSLFLTDDSSSESESEMDRKDDNHSQTKNLLQQQLSTKSRKCDEKTEGSQYSWALVKNLVIISFLMVAYFLCNIAFSTIAPFFPKEV